MTNGKGQSRRQVQFFDEDRHRPITGSRRADSRSPASAKRGRSCKCAERRIPCKHKAVAQGPPDRDTLERDPAGSGYAVVSEPLCRVTIVGYMISAPAPPANLGSDARRRGGTVAVCLAVGLFALNWYIARELFVREFTQQYGSIESSFIAFAGYAMRHWGDLSWYPIWFNGTPFHTIYQPGLHVTVAAIATVFQLTPQHAYHFVTGLTYCTGPVTLFWFCYRVTGRWGCAFATGVFYSIVSTSALLSRDLYAWMDGPFHPRRFEILTRWGEGPHITALTLLPLVLLSLYRAGVEKRRWWFPLAAVALASLVLTNWPGSVGLSMAIGGFCLAQVGYKRIAWARLLSIAVVAYLLAGRWIPPSTVVLVQRNAQQSDGHYFGPIHLLYFGVLMALLAGIEFGLRRARAGWLLRFAVSFAVISGAVTCGWWWFGVALLPQPPRFQVELEMAIAIAVCYLGKRLLESVPAGARAALIMALIIAAVPVAKSNRRFARGLTTSMDMKRLSEYKMAQAFSRLRPADRVFVSGNVSYWMNVWTETPQVDGCCDPGVPDIEHRISNYMVFSGQNAGARDAEISILWLRAWGATAIGVNGPRSTEPFKPMNRPFKFDGALPVLWRDGDDVIYDIPSIHRSLAHVIPSAALITRAPKNGLDTEQLERFVTALEDPAAPDAAFQWKTQHSAHVSATVQPGQLVSVQITHDPGWRALVNNVQRPVLRDKLGMMAIDTGCRGPCAVDLVYDGGAEAKAMAVLQMLGLLLAVCVPLFLPGRGGHNGGASRKAGSVEPAVPAQAVGDHSHK